MRAEYTPGQYVNVRASELEPWQVRIFMGWNEPRVIQGRYQHARVMLRDAYQYSPTAPSESYALIQAWHPMPGQYVWRRLCGVWYASVAWPWKKAYYFGGHVAPITLPPFVKPGDKY